VNDLLELNLPSLELHWLQNDSIWCYKILFGYVDMRANEFLKKLYKKRNNNNVRANFFAERIVMYGTVCLAKPSISLLYFHSIEL